jgi:hypothetical protein
MPLSGNINSLMGLDLEWKIQLILSKHFKHFFSFSSFFVRAWLQSNVLKKVQMWPQNLFFQKYQYEYQKHII